MRKAGMLCVLLFFLFLPLAAAGAQEQEGPEEGQKGLQQEENDAANSKTGEKQLETWQHSPFLYKEQTFVPLRELGSLLDFHVGWDPQKGQVIVSGEEVQFTALPREDNKLVVQVAAGDDEAGEEDPVELEEPRLWDYRKSDGNIFVSLRHMAALFSWHIDWGAQSWTISLWTADTKNETEPPALSFTVEQWLPPEDKPGADPVGPTEKVAYLTFDDGPSEQVTPRILDALKAENVPATFFVTGAQAEKFPQVICQIHEEGHTIGNHTYSHRASIIYSCPEVFMHEVCRTENIIYEITGERTRILRAPYGSYPHLTAPFRQALEESGYKYVDWNVDSMDTRDNTVPVETIVDAVKQQVPGKEQVFILFHDLPEKTTTAEALPEIIFFLRERQYTFRALTYDVDMLTHW